MATATCAPELFVNVIGTYLTQSDLGVGTVVGSAVCNILGVTACAGLATSKVQTYNHSSLGLVFKANLNLWAKSFDY